jgi:hypothetical protein
MSPGMGDLTVPGFSLTPDEEKFFVGFLRRRALPWSAAVSALAGGLTAGLLMCSRPSGPATTTSAEQAAALADDQARAELARLREELEALRAQPAPAAAPSAAPAADDARVAELRRSLDGLKRELQTIATSVTELQRRTSGESTPASPDAAASAEFEPLRKRVYSVEARQDREESARLEWAGNVEQRVRNLELARRTREAEEQAALQGLQDRLQRVEQSLGASR